MFALKFTVIAAIFSAVTAVGIIGEKENKATGLTLAKEHPLKQMISHYQEKAVKKLADAKNSPRALSDDFLEPVTYDPITKKFVYYSWHSDEGCSDERLTAAWGMPIGQCHEVVQEGMASIYVVQMFGMSASKDVLVGTSYFSDADCTMPIDTETMIIDDLKKSCTWQYAIGEKNYYKKMDFVDDPPKFHDGTLIKVYQTTGECFLGERGMVEFQYLKTAKCYPERSNWNFINNAVGPDRNTGCYDGEWFFNSFTASSDNTCSGTDVTIRAFGKVKYDYYCRREEKKSATGLSWGFPRVECV